MRKTWILSLAAAMLTMASSVQTEAAVVMLGGPGVTLNAGQPIQVVVGDASGNSSQQTVYYNPAIGGVDLDTGWAGPNASVYFPTLGTGYVWYNGFWVDEGGYYWNNGARVYIGHPHWRDFWTGYWHGRPYWHGGGHEGWHGHHPEVSVHVHERVVEHGGGHHRR